MSERAAWWKGLLRPESPGLGAVLGVLVAVGFWLVAIFTPRPLLALELWLHGWLLRQRGPVLTTEVETPPIVIVGMDDPTYSWIAKTRGLAPTEWTRDIHAEVLLRLRTMGARAVGFDVLFEADKEGTEALAAAMKARPDTVVATILGESGDARRKGAARGMVRPHPSIQAVSTQAMISTSLDRDGRVRWYLEHVAGLDVEPVPSMAVALGRKVAPERTDATLAAATRDFQGAFLVDYRDRSPAFPVHSMRDVLDPDGALAQAFQPSLPPDLGSRRVVTGPLGRGPGVIEVVVDPPDEEVEVLALPVGLDPWAAVRGRGSLRLEGLGDGPYGVFVARDLGGGAYGVCQLDKVQPGGPPRKVTLPPVVEAVQGTVTSPERVAEAFLLGVGKPAGDGYYRDVVPVTPRPDGRFETVPVADDMFVSYVNDQQLGPVFRGTPASIDAGKAPEQSTYPEGELLVGDAPPGTIALIVDPQLPAPPYVGGTALEATPHGGRLRMPQPRDAFRLLLAAPDGRRGAALADSGNPFRGAVVLVGPTSKVDQDYHVTPIGNLEGEGEGKMPGVEIHAHALWTLLAGRSITSHAGLASMSGTLGERGRGLWGLLLLLVVLCAGAGVAIRWAMPRGGVLVVVVLVCGWIGFALSRFVDARDWWPMATPVAALALTYVVVLWVNYITVEAKRKQIRETFQHYLDPDIVRQLEADPEALELGGDQQQVTCFFSDIEGFSGFSEVMDPPELVDFINEYLTAMSDLLIKYGGWIDKFIGDAIVAVFNAPRSQPDHARLCVQAALEMKAREEALRDEWKARGLPQVKTRIGINTGMAVVGNVGTGNRKNYTILGDAVNLAARLEALNKSYGTYLMIGEATYREVGGQYDTRELDLVRVKGKKVPAAVYQVVAERGQAGPEFDKALEAWELAVAAYRNQRWEDAEKHFERVLRHLPDDPPTKMYLERMNLLRKVPPPDDWDGVWTMEHK